MFYFHGAKDEDFALVSDPNLHINARFIGFRPAGRSRNFTWVQAVAVMFDSHSLIVAARREAVWDDDADALDIIYGGNSVSIPGDSEAEWRILAEGPEREVSVERTAERTAEAIRVQLAVSGIVEMDLKAVAIGEEENRTHGHGHGLPAGDAFAHLEMQFKFGKLSNQVEGILGRTYRPGYISPAKRGVPMPVLGGRGLVPDSGIHVSPLQVLRRHSAVLKNPSRQRQ